MYDVDVIRITASSSAKYLWSLGQWHLLSILLLGLRLKVRRRYRTEGFDKESRSIQRLIFGTHRYPWPSFQTQLMIMIQSVVKWAAELVRVIITELNLEARGISHYAPCLFGLV